MLRQRPPQVCDTNIQSGSGAILAGSVSADLTVFGHDGHTDDDRSEYKQREHDQPRPGPLQQRR